MATTTRTTTRPRQRIVGYHATMPPRRKAVQRSITVDDELWRDVQTIAAARRETVSAVIRAALLRYREENQRYLAD